MHLLQWLATKSLLRPLAPEELGFGRAADKTQTQPIPGAPFTPFYPKKVEQNFSEQILEIVREPNTRKKTKT